MIMNDIVAVSRTKNLSTVVVGILDSVINHK